MAKGEGQLDWIAPEPSGLEVIVCGPNLNDQSKGEFHVHYHGCPDLRHYGPGTRNGGADIKPWDTFTVESKLELVREIYADILDESDAKPEEYLTAFHWFPCVDSLDIGITTSLEPDGVIDSQARAAGEGAAA